MNKTDEELNLAEAMAKRHGVLMCDENGDTHGEELYCVGIDDIADIIREALAEQELYEPEGRCKECLAYNGHLDYCSKSAKREWVDLSNDEIDELIRKWHSPDMGLLDFAWAVIAAFKEKNK